MCGLTRFDVMCACAVVLHKMGDRLTSSYIFTT